MVTAAIDPTKLRRASRPVTFMQREGKLELIGDILQELMAQYDLPVIEQAAEGSQYVETFRLLEDAGTLEEFSTTS